MTRRWNTNPSDDGLLDTGRNAQRGVMGIHPPTEESIMNISKANAATLGHIFADALHQCDNLAERRGVLRAREAVLDAFEHDCQRDTAYWKRYLAFADKFQDRLDYLEPLTPTDDYEPAVSPHDCAIGGEEDSNWT